MANFIEWMRGIAESLNMGIGPIRAENSAILYPYILGFLGFSVLLMLVWIIWDIARIKARYVPGEVIKEILFLLGQAILIYLLWLTLSTPHSEIPWVNHIHDGSWRDAVYSGVAIILRALAALFTIGTLIGIWLSQITTLIQAEFSDASAPVQAIWYFVIIRLVAAGFLGQWLFLVYIWEVQGWPVTFLVIAEILLLPSAAPYFLRLFLGNPDFLLITGRDRAFRFRLFWTQVAILIGSVGVLLLHVMDQPALAIFSIFYTITLLDGLVSTLYGSFDSRDDLKFTFLSTWRWSFTVPIALCVTYIGASGGFSGIGINSGLDNRIWLIAGGAAVAFVFFRPFLDKARIDYYQKTRNPEERDFWKLMVRIYPFLAEPQTEQTAELPGEAAVSAVEPGALVPVDQNAQASRAGNANTWSLYIDIFFGPLKRFFHRLRYGELPGFKEFRMLNVPIFYAFFLIAVAFYYFSPFLHSADHTIGNWIANPFAAVSAMGALFAALVNFLNTSGLSRNAKRFSLYLFVITIIVAVAAFIVEVIPNTSFGSILTPAAFESTRLLLFELTVMLLMGHVLYFIRMVQLWKGSKPGISVEGGRKKR